MNNKICKTSIEIKRLSAAEADVWIQVEVERRTPGTELRGKLTGPRCPGVTTVEVAYPLQRLPRAPDEYANRMTVHALIPEPNLWSETTPFVYAGRLELWQDDLCVDVNNLVVGLKKAE